jgi:hypothetical protein
MNKSFEVVVTTTDGVRRALPVIAQSSCDAIFAVLTAFGDAALDSLGDVRQVKARAA